MSHPQASSSVTRHATCVAIGGRGVLIEGASGSGKSDLALRLIDRGAVLVSDDQTRLTLCDGSLTATAPASIAGKLEVRGLGILTFPHVDAPIALAVRLGEAVERMPVDAISHIVGVDVPSVVIDAFEPSAPVKVEHALAVRVAAA